MGFHAGGLRRLKQADWLPYPQRKPLQRKHYLLWVRRPRYMHPTYEIGYWDGQKFMAIRDKYIQFWARLTPPPMLPLLPECKRSVHAPKDGICAHKF